MSSGDITSASAQGTVSSGVGDDGRPRALWNQPQIGLHGYLTPQRERGDVERGNPLPYTLPPEASTRDVIRMPPPGSPKAPQGIA